jgi:hypothetical protein
VATARAIITRAMRKLRLLAAGGVPTANEAADGLAVLQGIYDGWTTNGTFGPLSQLLGSESPYVGDVIAWGTPDGETDIELPTRLQDARTGETVPPPDLSYAEVVKESDNTRRAFVWDARWGGWRRIDSIGLDSDAPLSGRGAEGLAALLALHMAEEFGAQVGPVVLREAGSFQRSLAASPGEAPTATQAVYF